MILVTGGTGFIGRWLVDHLAGDETVVATRHGPDAPEALDGAEVRPLDVRDGDAVHEMVADLEPDEVYHLAAQSFPAVSWEEPERTLDTNVLGTCHLFEAFKEAGIAPRTFVACSSAEYGVVPEDEAPVAEDRILRPVHPYGVSKVGQEMLAVQYQLNDGIPAVCGRIFNTTGPGKSGDVAADFAERVARAEVEDVSTLRVGNLSPRRDITDVRDMVRAIVQITRKGEPGDVVNLCSGRAIEIREIAETLVDLADVPLEIETDPELLRPTDEPIIQGDNARLVERTGWSPAIGIERTLEDMLDHARQQLA